MCTENYHWHHDYVRLAWDSGFAFNIHKPKINLDWNSIGLLDVDRVARDRDVAVVEKYMGTILNYCLDEEQTRILEPTFVKVFQLSQLSVQYLQFCKRYLDNTVVLLKRELTKYKEENSNLNCSIEELKTEINNLKKKIKELKQSMQTQQLQSTENILPTPFKCSVCSKMFLNEDFLLSHFKRRHEIDSNPFQTETDRLQLEIKELKERLNSTEKYIQGDHNTKVTEKQYNIPNNDAVVENAVHVGDLKEKFEHLKQYVEKELTVLRNEKHYQEKYEKWFEMVFQRLDNSKKELHEREDRLNIIGDGDRLSRKESSTQTIAESYVETETMTDVIPCTFSEEKLEPKPIIMDIDVEKIQKDIRMNTENHLDQMQDVLEKKLSGGFEQIQTQMNSFWKRLSDMELEKQQSSVNQTQILHKTITDTVVASRPLRKGDQNLRPDSISSASSSESLQKNTAREPRPKPAPRVMKKFPTIIQSKPKENISPTKKLTIIKPTAIQKPQDTSSEDSSSDDTFEIVKPPVKVSAARDKSKPQRVEDVVISKSKPTTRYIKAKPQQSTVKPSDSESEQETLSEEPQVKPSNTSTLGQRSLTSLKQMVEDKDVMKGLNNELQDMVDLRLKEIGISPHWTGIPERTFKQTMQVVRHQGELSKKTYSNYSKVRQAILKILNEKVRKDSKITTQDHKKQKENNVLVIKQPLSKKKITNEKKNKTTMDSTHMVDINSDDSEPKLNRTFIKENIDKENITQVSTNIPQEKIGSVGATPIKKKVLFDLEDSSSTSKINAGNGEIQQIQKNALESRRFNFERTVNVVSPVKKQVVKDVSDAVKTPVHKPQTLKINDGESTTSLASSILQGSNPQVNRSEIREHLIKEDISDWDISDILT